MNRLQTAPAGANPALRPLVCGWCGMRAALLCSLTALVACGGAGGSGGGGVPATPSSRASDESLAAPVVIVSTLVADDGSMMPSVPAAVPADPGARTRAGRYATAAQAAQLAQALQDRLVPVAVGCCSPAAVDEAVLIAWGVQAAANLPPDAPFLVHGPDARLNAAAAESLAEGGATRVWVVAQ